MFTVEVKLLNKKRKVTLLAQNNTEIFCAKILRTNSSVITFLHFLKKI